MATATAMATKQTLGSNSASLRSVREAAVDQPWAIFRPTSQKHSPYDPNARGVRANQTPDDPGRPDADGGDDDDALAIQGFRSANLFESSGTLRTSLLSLFHGGADKPHRKKRDGNAMMGCYLLPNCLFSFRLRALNLCYSGWCDYCMCWRDAQTK